MCQTSSAGWAISRGTSCMKTLRFISTFFMLSLAAVVTAGSMYVTVSAAVQQESTDFTAPPKTTPVQNTPGVADGVAPDLEAAIESLDAALDKTQILSDRQHHVILDEKGGFAGRLSSLSNAAGAKVPAANLKVTLAHHGSEVSSTVTDADGRFSFTGLPEGVVAIWAEGENSLMLFSFVLFGQNSPVTGNADLHVSPVELAMDSAVASGADIATVKEIMFPYLNMEDKRFAGEVAAEDQEFNLGAGEVSTTLRHHRVGLQNDGSLKGEVSILDERTGRHREILDMTVHFVRNGVRVASSKVSNDGSFIASGLSPGVHSVVAVGQDGVLVSCVDIVGTTYEDNTVQGADPGKFTPASTVAASLDFAGCPVGPGNLAAFAGASGGGPGQIAANAVPPVSGPNAMGGGTFGSGGGFGGGGGGFGGGGGLGALLAGGIGGAIGYLIGDNNNNDLPASPGI